MSDEPAAVVWAYWEDGPRGVALGVPRPVPRDHRASRRAVGAARAVAPRRRRRGSPTSTSSGGSRCRRPNYRSDYVRSRVLQRYGGVWIDVDTVALSPLVAAPRRARRHGHGVLRQGTRPVLRRSVRGRPGHGVRRRLGGGPGPGPVAARRLGRAPLRRRWRRTSRGRSPGACRGRPSPWSVWPPCPGTSGAGSSHASSPPGGLLRGIADHGRAVERGHGAASARPDPVPSCSPAEPC